MKKLLVLILSVSMVLSMVMSVSALRYTRGYYRSNGTYVSPYRSTSPNSYKSDNWSSKGNYNPYTGKKGYKSYYGY
jgi:hypothetical protein